MIHAKEALPFHSAGLVLPFCSSGAAVSLPQAMDTGAQRLRDQATPACFDSADFHGVPEV